MWLAFAVSYFMLCRASDVWAYADGKVHPEVSSTRECLAFSLGGIQVEFGTDRPPRQCRSDLWRRSATNKEKGA